MKSYYNKIKNSKFNNAFNKFVYSPYSIVLFGLFALLANVFSLEIYFYILVGIYSLYICILGNDFLPIMPLFGFCYISPSAKNNPGLSTNSIFYGWAGYLMFAIVAIVILAFLIRVGLDKNMGYKKLFTQKRALLIGFCCLGFTYLTSGIGSDNYFTIFKNNLIFSLIQFVSLFLLYFIFTATVNWKNVRKDYFAWFGVVLGIVVSCELLNIYFFDNVIQDGTIMRKMLFTGWGQYNNIGAVISMSIPFAFYFACKKKNNYLYLILGTFLICCLFLTCSRGSIVCGVFIFVVCFIITFFKSEHKKQYRISSLVLLVITIILCILFKDVLIKLFQRVPDIINSSSSTGFNDSSRFKIYKAGLDAFKKYPIFGQSFYASGFIPYDYSQLNSFSNFFPPRWHNTFVQILSSCGVIGLIAYLFHRFQTIKLLIKKPSLEKAFIGLSILALLMMSLLDCHFFNVGPTLIYSMALAFAEKINSKE